MLKNEKILKKWSGKKLQIFDSQKLEKLVWLQYNLFHINTRDLKRLPVVSNND